MAVAVERDFSSSSAPPPDLDHFLFAACSLGWQAMNRSDLILGPSTAHLSDLACLMTKQYHGEIAHEIMRTLLVRGPHTARELRLSIRSLGTSLVSLRTALIVLIQHKVISFRENDRGDVVYHAEPVAVLLRSIWPIFLELSLRIVRTTLEEDQRRNMGQAAAWSQSTGLTSLSDAEQEAAIWVLQCFMRHGMLTLEQVLDLAVTGDGMISSASPPVTHEPRVIRWAFSLLIRAKVLRKSGTFPIVGQAPSLVRQGLGQDDEDLTPLAKRMRRKTAAAAAAAAAATATTTATTTSAAAASLTSSSAAVAKAIAAGGGLLSKLTSIGTGSSGSKSLFAHVQQADRESAGPVEFELAGVASAPASSGEKRLPAADAGLVCGDQSMDTSAASTGPGSSLPGGLTEHLFEVHMDHLITQLRDDMIVEYVGLAIKPEAGSIIRSILELGGAVSAAGLSSGNVRLYSGDFSSPVTLASLYAAVKRQLPNMRDEQLFGYVELMQKPMHGFLVKTRAENGQDAVAVHLKRMVYLLKDEHTNAWITEEFSLIGNRVYRMLKQYGQLEQKNIVEGALAPPRDVRELLYKMLKHGVVQLQELPKTADRNPQKTIYTWFVDQPTAHAAILTKMVVALFNMRVRWYATKLKADELLRATDNRLDKLPQEELDQLARISNAENRLELSMAEITKLVLLMMLFQPI